MEIYQIKYFLTLSETLNFTRAAALCGVTQPALTRAIQRLEDELGAPLLRRERSNTHLTELGLLMKPHFERMITECQTVKSTAHAFLTLEHATLKVGIMCTIGPLRSMGFFNEFRMLHPGVTLTLIEGVPSRLAELLLEGTIDCAILAQPDPFGKAFAAVSLYRERFVVAFPAGHRFQSQGAVRPEDLTGESYLSRINCEFRDRLSEVCRQHGVTMRGAYQSEREDWIQVMVVAGMGICFMPEFSPLIAGLQARLLHDPEVIRDVCLITVAGRQLSPVAATFAQALTAYSWAADSVANQR